VQGILEIQDRKDLKEKWVLKVIQEVEKEVVEIQDLQEKLDPQVI
jgi:hypothetical protein